MKQNIFNALKYIKEIVAICAIVLVAGFIVWTGVDRTQQTLGSQIDGQGYMATTTGSQGQGLVAGVYTLKSSPGMFGSYIITGANTGQVNFYDATTSDATLRGNTATSSILIASFPASTAVGTYTFDVTTARGLLVTVSGTAATGTITHK